MLYIVSEVLALTVVVVPKCVNSSLTVKIKPVGQGIYAIQGLWGVQSVSRIYCSYLVSVLHVGQHLNDLCLMPLIIKKQQLTEELAVFNNNFLL